MCGSVFLSDRDRICVVASEVYPLSTPHPHTAHPLIDRGGLGKKKTTFLWGRNRFRNYSIGSGRSGRDRYWNHDAATIGAGRRSRGQLHPDRAGNGAAAEFDSAGAADRFHYPADVPRANGTGGTVSIVFLLAWDYYWQSHKGCLNLSMFSILMIQFKKV